MFRQYRAIPTTLGVDLFRKTSSLAVHDAMDRAGRCRCYDVNRRKAHSAMMLCTHHRIAI
jgi:hypothetical protein